MKKLGFKILIPILLVTFMAFQTDKPAYKIFDKKGKTSSYQDLLKEALKADVVLFGESHNNPILHWLQIELTKDLYQEKSSKRNLILGAEMFEADNQVILDEYVKGIITEKNFEAEARLWNNYKTDYKPLVEFAKDNNLHFIATNIPRRYASLVAKKGLSELDSLSEETKSYMMPLPVEVDLKQKAYANMLKMMGVHGYSQNGNVSESAANFAYAQAVKDATMAHRINKFYQKNAIFLHFNGSYHSDNYESIVFYLKKYNSKLKIMTITAADQNSLDTLEKEGVADFAVITPVSMTKTY